MNVEVAFTMSNQTTEIIFDALLPHQTQLLLPNGHMLQVIPSLETIISSPLSTVKLFQYAALIQEERILLAWHENVDEILNVATAIEGKLLSLVSVVQVTFSNSELTRCIQICGHSGSLLIAHAPSYPVNPSTSGNSSTSHFQTELKGLLPPAGPIFDEEAVKSIDSLDRPLALTSAVYVGLSLGLIIFLIIGMGISKVVYEILVDGNWVRTALLVTIPVFILFGIFFMIVIFGNLFQVFGPTKNIATNTRYHSAERPNLKRAYAQGFRPPRMTIQMPIYTESLEGVIKPTVASLKAAISHYESHGGRCSFPCPWPELWLIRSRSRKHLH